MFWLYKFYIIEWYLLIMLDLALENKFELKNIQDTAFFQIVLQHLEGIF